jgi:Mn-dependent DtxR family transcriptional regulator
VGLSLRRRLLLPNMLNVDHLSVLKIISRLMMKGWVKLENLNVDLLEALKK